MMLIVREDVGGMLSEGPAGEAGELVAVARSAKPGGKGRIVRWLHAIFLGAAVGLSGACVMDGQPTPTPDARTSTVRGVVRDTAGKTGADVDVRLERKDESGSKDGTTNAEG